MFATYYLILFTLIEFIYIIFSILHLDRRLFWNRFKVHLFHLLKQPCEPRWLPPPSENRGWCRIKNAPFEKTGRRKLVMRLQQKPFQKGILQILPECEHTIDSRPELMSKTMTHTYIYIFIHTIYIYTPNFQGSSVVQKLTLAFCIDYSRCIHVLSCKGFGRSRMPHHGFQSSPQEFC